SVTPLQTGDSLRVFTADRAFDVFPKFVTAEDALQKLHAGGDQKPKLEAVYLALEDVSGALGSVRTDGEGRDFDGWRRDEDILNIRLRRLQRSATALGAPACALREWAPAYLARVHSLYQEASTALRPTGNFVVDAGRACKRFSEDVGTLEIPTNVPDAQL